MHKIDILMLHKVCTSNESYFIPSMALSEKLFTSFIKTLAKFKTIDTIENTLLSEHKKNIVALTFDDGYLDNYWMAQHVLFKIGIPATFYIPWKQIENQEVYWWDYLYNRIKQNPAHVFSWILKKSHLASFISTISDGTFSGRDPEFIAYFTRCLVQQLNRTGYTKRQQFLKNMENECGPYDGDRLLMNWTEIQQLIKDGFTIGSHSLSHEPLTDISPKEAVNEIKLSKKQLEKKLNISIEGFSYPRGKCNAALAHAVESSGYRYAVTTHYGTNTDVSHPFTLSRRNIDTFNDFRKHFSSLMYMIEISGALDNFFSERRNRKI